MKAYTVILFSVLFAIYFGTHTNSCSYPEGWKPPTIIQQINLSDQVLFGKVLDTYPHQYYDSAYTANMEVYCIVKGRRVPENVNITNAGYLPGMCTATELEKGKLYLVPVYSTMEAGVLQATGVSFTSRAQVREALKACKLNPPTWPLGVDESNFKLRCPIPLRDTKCKKQ